MSADTSVCLLEVPWTFAGQGIPKSFFEHFEIHLNRTYEPFYIHMSIYHPVISSYHPIISYHPIAHAGGA